MSKFVEFGCMKQPYWYFLWVYVHGDSWINSTLNDSKCYFDAIK